MARAIVFPGQGSQTPEMRETVQQHRPDLLEACISAVGFDPFPLVDERTDCAQPALYCAALACWSALERPAGDFMAGHSLGELAALAASEAVDEHDALRLTVARGRLMQEASERHPPNGMLAVRSDDQTAVMEVASEHGVVLANDNSPRQLVLAGTRAALEVVADGLRSRRIPSTSLPVAAAFHSPLMADAVRPFRELLSEITVRPPRVPVLSGLTALPFEHVQDQLAESLVSPVRWREILLWFKSRGVDQFLEPGPGRVLTALVRRTVPDASADCGQDLLVGAQQPLH